MSLPRTTNKNALRNFGHAGSGTLRFVGAELQQEAYETDQRVDVFLEFEPLTWNKATVTGQDEYRVQEVQVYDKDGTAIAGKYEPVGSWVPTGETRKANLYKPTNWSWLEKLVTW